MSSTKKPEPPGDAARAESDQRAPPAPNATEPEPLKLKPGELQEAVRLADEILAQQEALRFHNARQKRRKGLDEARRSVRPERNQPSRRARFGAGPINWWCCLTAFCWGISFALFFVYFSVKLADPLLAENIRLAVYIAHFAGWFFLFVCLETQPPS
mgnify:CR=1 FL=1